MGLWLTDEEQDHVDEVTAIMEDSNTGFGYKSTSTAKSDGTPKRGRLSLSCETAANMDYAKSATGVSAFGRSWFREKGLVTHWKSSDSTRTLGSKELGELTDSDREKIKARVLAKMGFTLSDWDRLNASPCLDKGLVAQFDAAVYEIKESGGRINDLARCLGLTLKPQSGKRRGKGATGCPRLQDCIKRHKARLANPEAYGVTTCAAVRCDAKFYKKNPSQKYCSIPCQESERNRRLREGKTMTSGVAVCAGDDCSEEFRWLSIGDTPRQAYCSPRCRRRAAKLRGRARQREQLAT